MTEYCLRCGNPDLGSRVGNCSACDREITGAEDPASRTVGFFHRLCWNTLASGGVVNGRKLDDSRLYLVPA